MKTFIFQCSNCKNDIEASEENCGATGICPHCQGTIVIPQNSNKRVTVIISDNTKKNAAEGSILDAMNKFIIIFVLLAIVVAAGVIAFITISTEDELEELEMQEEASAQPKVVTPRSNRPVYRPQNEHRPVVRRRVAASDKVVSAPPASAGREKKKPVSRTVPVRRQPVRRSVPRARVPQTPQKMYETFVKDLPARIEKIEQHIKTLSPARQEAGRKLVAGMKTMQISWQKRLEYIEVRNKKIAEAARRTYDAEMGRKLQARVEEYTRNKSDWGYNRKCIEFSQQLLNEFRNPQIDPNIRLVDAHYRRFSGNAIKTLTSGRIVRAKSILEVLVGRYADPSCLKELRSREFDPVLVKYGLPPECVQYNFNAKFVPKKRKTDERELIETLLYDGARPTAGNLANAVFRGDPRIVLLLLAAGMDPNAKDQNGETALFNAYRLENGSAVCDLLIAAGADPAIRNKQGKVAKDMAATGHFLSAWRQRDLNKIRQYFQAGGDPDMLLANGNTLLHDACTRNDFEMVQILFHYKVNPNNQGKAYYKPIATTYSMMIRYNSRQTMTKERFIATKIFKFMVENGTDIRVNPIGYGGTNLLAHTLSCYPRQQDKYYDALIALLLKHTGRFTENNWRSVCSRLAYLPSAASQKKIIKQIPAVYLQESVNAFFQSVYRRPKPEFVQFLAERNINFNTAQRTYIPDRQNPRSRRYTSKNVTPLYVAVHAGQSPEVIKALLKYGADANWSTNDGQKVIDVAQSEEVRNILRAAMQK